jgi:DNA-entry nuclease
VIQDNNPSFPKEDINTSSFETYSKLDELGRCQAAYANIGVDLMPTQERGNIGQIKPSGWQTIKYDNVDGKYLFNRCHLIGYQLTAENANDKNLITGTRYLNIEGMLPFENMIADYVKETENHVLYRVTPFFDGENLVASGVQMEGFSVEDKGEGICFNVYAYNVQPGIIIDYLSGESSLSDADQSMDSIDQTLVEIRGNSNSMIYHCPGQAAYEDMEDSKYLVNFDSEQEAIDAGYRKAKR